MDRASEESWRIGDSLGCGPARPFKRGGLETAPGVGSREDRTAFFDGIDGAWFPRRLGPARGGLKVAVSPQCLIAVSVTFRLLAPIGDEIWNGPMLIRSASVGGSAKLEDKGGEVASRQVNEKRVITISANTAWFLHNFRAGLMRSLVE